MHGKIGSGNLMNGTQFANLACQLASIDSYTDTTEGLLVGLPKISGSFIFISNNSSKFSISEISYV